MSDLYQKFENVQVAIARLNSLIETNEDAFIEHVGIKEIQAKKKAKGYHEYVLEDKAKLTMLLNIQKRIATDIKQMETDNEKSALKAK